MTLNAGVEISNVTIFLLTVIINGSTCINAHFIFVISKNSMNYYLLFKIVFD